MWHLLGLAHLFEMAPSDFKFKTSPLRFNEEKLYEKPHRVWVDSRYAEQEYSFITKPMGL